MARGGTTTYEWPMIDEVIDVVAIPVSRQDPTWIDSWLDPLLDEADKQIKLTQGRSKISGTKLALAMMRAREWDLMAQYRGAFQQVKPGKHPVKAGYQIRMADEDQHAAQMERIMKHVRVDGKHLIWTAGTTSNGYGHTQYNGKQVAAHRLMYEHLHGPIPQGQVVRHGQGCPRTCCGCLKVGTNADNMADRQREGNGSKLAPEVVALIKALPQEGCTAATYDLIGEIYGVSGHSIRRLVGGTGFDHVPVIDIDDPSAALADAYDDLLDRIQHTFRQW